MQRLLYALLTAAVGTDLVVTATTCSQPNKFGPQCAYDCHCSVDCDKTTGLCPGTCILPWSGPSCQRGNVAFSKPTQDSGVFEFNNAWTSSKAVDGNTNQEAVANSCYLSSYYRPPGQTGSPAPDAWMVVDLGQEYHTHDISVYGRATRSHRMNGTRLFVSNVSNDRQNPCYTFQAPGTRMNDTWDLTCDRRGRYVTLFDNTVAQAEVGIGNVFLEVCEIMVFVCSTGTFGSSCDQLCRCRDGSPCDFNGTCPNGCLDGFVGPTCSQACPNGTFGENCTQSCYCKSGTCDVTTGLCNGSCASGWRGPTCSQVCSVGSFGTDCTGMCRCKQGTCDHVTGLGCQGCEAGFQGSTCSTSTTCSQPSKFGPQCAYDCHCSMDCDKSTGMCPGTCILPWSGPSCQRENVAFSKPTQDSGVFEFNNAWTSSKAVDGNTNQEAVANSCYLSSFFRPPGQGNPPAPDAWMVVDLGQEYHTHDISVYGRATYSHRMNGTRLFVSNVFNDRQNPCYTLQAPGTRMNDTWDLTCDRRGRYVTIFDNTVAQVDVDIGNGHVALEVCEIMVFACSAGSFGTNCTGMCRCKQGTCDHVTGLGCPDCEAGFQGNTCSAPCGPTQFGENCAFTCNCDSPGCDALNGICLVPGCLPGFHGDSCSTGCQTGSWGADCLQTCGNCSSPCDPRDGTCDTCLPGWEGDRCQAQSRGRCNHPQLLSVL